MTLCIYHGNCDDGFGAAWAVRRGLGPDVEFFAASYQAPPPDVTDRKVVIVDFSYKRPVLEEMAKSAASILILDHHKTAAEDLSGFAPPPADLPGHKAWLPTSGVYARFDMNRSGAGLAWDHFVSDTRTPLIDYLEDRDLWTKKLPGVDEFTAALRSYPQDFEVWDKFFVPDLIKEGVAIQRYYRNLIEQHKRHFFFRRIAGHYVPVVNASLFMASELAGELADGYPFAAIYAESFDDEAGHLIATFSLRSRKEGADVSEIAKGFGGGGHKNAAGFRIPVAVLGQFAP